MKYRRRIEIIADMLTVTQVRTKKTHIMYRGNLSFRVLNDYLSAIIKTNLVGYDAATECYLITEKGRLFLQVFNRYKKLVSRLERQNTFVKEKQSLLESMCFGADLADQNGLAGYHNRIANRTVSIAHRDS